ncbi:MAG: hypothetical protein ACLQVN_19920 [Bryobacteraceae bacterium]
MAATSDQADTALARATRQVEQACDLLVAATPKALAQSPVVLAEAVAGLRDLRQQVGSFRGPEARSLRNAVLKARRLLDRAAVFHARWQTMLAAMNGGYTALGSPAAIPSRTRSYWEG